MLSLKQKFLFFFLTNFVYYLKPDKYLIKLSSEINSTQTKKKKNI